MDNSQSQPPSCRALEGNQLPESGSKSDDGSRRWILVPTNFTIESTYALRHAQGTARVTGHRVMLLHVLEAGEQEAQAQECLRQQLCAADDDVPIDTMLEHGVVSRVVPAVGQRLGTDYIVLGSHDVKIPQNQKLSTSLKLLTHGDIPYVVVQERPKSDRYQRVIYPIDFTDETNMQTRWLDNLCQHHNPAVCLLRPDVNEVDLLDCIDQNISKAIRILAAHHARYTVRTVEGKTDYAVEILQTARDLSADLIVVTTSYDPRVKGDYMLEPHERKLLLQAADIPVMTINPTI